MSTNNTHVINEPTLNIFPYILDHPNLFEMLIQNTTIKNTFINSTLKTTFKQNSNKAIKLFKKEVLKFWPAFCDTRAMDSRHSEGHEGHDVHLVRLPHGSIGDLAQELVGDANGIVPGCPFPDPSTRADGKGGRSKLEVLYTPFEIKEVILNMPSNASALNGLLNFYK